MADSSYKTVSYKNRHSERKLRNKGEDFSLPPIRKKYLPGSKCSIKNLSSYPYSEKALDMLPKDDLKFKIISQKKKMANMSNLFAYDVGSFYDFRNYLVNLTNDNPDFKGLKSYLNTIE